MICSGFSNLTSVISPGSAGICPMRLTLCPLRHALSFLYRLCPLSPITFHLYPLTSALCPFSPQSTIRDPQSRHSPFPPGRRLGPYGFRLVERAYSSERLEAAFRNPNSFFYPLSPHHSVLLSTFSVPNSAFLYSIG
jgi:hypothetical protein